MNLIPSEIELKEAFNALKGIEIPHIPVAVLALQQELLKSDPDMSKIGSILSTDPVLSGMALKTINSAKFGLPRKIESISQATVLLGLTVIKEIILVSALKRALGESSPFQSYIWHSTQAIAVGAKALSFSIEDVPVESAYLAGLFQNTGALILEKISEDYSTKYVEGLAYPVSCLSLENNLYGTNHAIISFLLAKNWQLPEKVCIAIYHSHNESSMEIEDPMIKALIAILKISEISTSHLLHTDLEFSSEASKSLANGYLELATDSYTLNEMNDELIALTH